MKNYIVPVIALGVVTVWGMFSYGYLGVEDGSSGLSLLGWIHAAYFLPGLFLVAKLKGSHSNADLPLMAGIGWLTYSLVAVGAAHVVSMIMAKSKRAIETKAAPDR